MTATPLLCGIVLVGACFAASAFTPADDAQLSWESIGAHRSAAGVVRAWRARTELSAQDILLRLSPACGLFHRALRVKENWLFTAQQGTLRCVLSLHSLNAPLEHGVLTVLKTVPASSSAPPPIDGPVFWQHEQPGEGAAWLIQVHQDWREALMAQGWTSGLAGAVWRRGSLVLEVLDVVHDQQRYVLIVCRACRGEQP